MSRVIRNLRLVFNIFRDQRPELVDVDDGTIELVEEDSVVVYASSIIATSGVLLVRLCHALTGLLFFQFFLKRVVTSALGN